MARIKVRFTRPYRGGATKERYYEPGDTASFSSDVVEYLESVGAVERVRKPRAKPESALVEEAPDGS